METYNFKIHTRQIAKADKSFCVSTCLSNIFNSSGRRINTLRQGLRLKRSLNQTRELIIKLRLLSYSTSFSSLLDDYRLTAAISIVKWVIQRYENGNTDEKLHSDKEPLSPHQGCGTSKTSSNTQLRGSAKSRAASRAPSRATSNVIPVKALTLALEVCRDFLKCKEHLDVDEPINKVSCPNNLHVVWPSVN